MMRLRSKAVGWARLFLKGACVAWALGVIWSLTRSAARGEETLGMLILGGGILFLMARGLRTWERSIRRECRCLSKELARAGQSPASCWSAKFLASCLLQSDLERLRSPHLRRRLQRFLESFVQVLKESGMDRQLWLQAVSVPLWTLESARAHWSGKDKPQRPDGEGTKPFWEFRDEEILELLLASIVEISALFRLHLWVWGMPTRGFGRGSISFLRRSWLRFCAMEPAEVAFPPSLPGELTEAMRQQPALAKGKELYQAWVAWLGKGQGLPELIRQIASR